MTNDQFAYVVATHIDKHHVHNHIVICSTALDCQHKYRDVKRSGKDLAQLSDEICEEHQLSVIRDPQNKTVSYDKWQGNQRKLTHRDELRMIIDTALRMQPDGFDALMQLLEDAGCLIKRGAQISIKPPEGKRYIRLDTLGPEYDEASLRRTLARDHVHIPKIPRGDFTESQVKRLIDIEAKLRAGRGKGYQVWAERNNIDAKAQIIIFLKDHHISSVEELNDQIQELTDQQKELKASIREKQNRILSKRTKRKLTREEKAQIKAVMRQTRANGKQPHSAQQTIPYDRIWPDGICLVDGKLYTKTVQFQDVNYQLAQNEDKTAIFDGWCDFLNYFDSSIRFQFSFLNLAASEDSFEESILIYAIANGGAVLLATEVVWRNDGSSVKVWFVTGDYEAIREIEALEGFQKSEETLRFTIDESYVVPDEMPRFINYKEGEVIQTGFEMTMTPMVWAGAAMALAGVLLAARYIMRGKKRKRRRR